MGKALITPGFRKMGMIYAAIGIIGATVMPHNLYLHSALVQSRKLQKDERSIRRGIRFNTIDSIASLTVAFFVNAAILILAAMVFFGKDSVLVAGEGVVVFGGDADWIRVAYLTLAPLMGTAVASVLFAVALLASGQSSTITGTLAGQVVMEGFMHWRIPALASTSAHTQSGHFACGCDHWDSRQQQRKRLAHAQPGNTGSSTPVCDVPAPASHFLPESHGKMEEWMVPARCRMGKRELDYSARPLRTPGFDQRGVACHHRQLKSKSKGDGMYKTILVTLEGTRRTDLSLNTSSSLQHSRRAMWSCFTLLTDGLREPTVRMR